MIKEMFRLSNLIKLKDYRFRPLFIKIIYIVFLCICSGCNIISFQNTSFPGAITGKVAKSKINSAFSNVSFLDTLNTSLSQPPGNSCPTTPNTIQVIVSESPGNETFQQGYQNAAVDLDSNKGTIYNITGTINSNSDYYFFYFYSNQTIDTTFTWVGGAAVCLLYANASEGTNNTNAPISSAIGEQFVPSAEATLITGPDSPNNNEIYISCSGSSGDTYQIQGKNITNSNSGGSSGSGSQQNKTIPNSIASYVFEDLVHINENVNYTASSVNDCVKNIDSLGPLVSMINKNSYEQSVQCGYPYNPIDITILLSEACKLEEAGVIQLGDFGFKFYWK
ncbi:hypothetical protein EHQ81_12675 [Leptospira selangorensis]|uniref:Uncharacterized protein n=1 Tax=Leptospira selangorensis TaxID=2484982 RepID=A0A5F2C6Q9_9LEPT|nr:hypothetical protein [Leptospira selangorensis]TGM12740.1 hypothetical protein EHQ81_12675 [Leptospira selangorensis]TGM30801.1 hypothetical protein EHQ82_00515 [Leptospira selangorensis]